MPEPIFDAYAPLSYKRALGRNEMPRKGPQMWVAPTWVDDEAKRRLMAYTILRAMQDNVGRWFRDDLDVDRQEEVREYGDAALLVETIMSAVIGDEQEIVVPGAEDRVEPEDEINLTPTQRAARARPTQPAEAGTDPEADAAFELQEWLRQWGDAERLPLKMIEGERTAVGLGDGVYTLGWSPDRKRARLRVWDPGFYFPVLGDGNEDDFPTRVHLAWEFTRPGDNKVLIRRITWELGPIELTLEGALVREGDRIEPAHENPDRPGEFIPARVVRAYPWNQEQGQAAEVLSDTTCYLTDATFEMRNVRNIDDFVAERATYTVDGDGPINRRDLGIDFMPVIHVPNTPALLEQFGRSSLSSVAQILDDLANADSDLQRAAVTSAQPIFSLEKGSLGPDKPVYEPGAVVEVGEGRIVPLDTSGALTALIAYLGEMKTRLSVNSRVPEAAIGRIKPSEVPSGIALMLGFGPLRAMIRHMRLTRDEKYPLLLKFVWRLAIANGAEDVPALWMPAEIAWGSYIPQDVAAAVQEVTQLRTAGLLSRETAIRRLMEVGLPVEDAAEEVARIEHEDFEGAIQLVEATGDVQAAGDYLGRTAAAPITPTLPIVPPTNEPPEPAAP